MSNNRIFSIDWLKGVMIFIIVAYHSSFTQGFRGYLGVDVFFFISGYFLMSSFLRKPTTATCYTWGRIKQIAAPYLLCILLAGALALFANAGSAESFIDTTGKVFSASIFASEFGGEFTRAYFIIGYWFLSVLIICSFILYAMLQYSERLSTMLLFPLIVLFGYNALLSDAPSLNTLSKIGPIGAPIIRGLYEMAAGAMICHIYVQHKSSIERRATLINMLGLLSFILFSAILFTKETLDKYTIVTIPFMLLAAVMDKSWLNAALGKIKGGLIARMGRYTLYIYCIHGPVLTRVDWFNDRFLHSTLNGISLFAVELIAVALASVVFYYLCQFAVHIIRHRENQPDHTRL